MKLDLTNILNRSLSQQDIKLVALDRSIESIPAKINAEVIDIAILKALNSKRFIISLMLTDSGQTIKVESDTPIPKGQMLTIHRQNGELHWNTPSQTDQLKAIFQLQQSLLANKQTALPDTMHELSKWQQQLQAQSNLSRPLKQQLALLNQLLTSPIPKPAHSPLQAAAELQHRVLNSGAFFEAKLANGQAIDAKLNDQKFLLMRLFKQVQSAIPVLPNSPPPTSNKTNHSLSSMSWITLPSTLNNKSDTLGKPSSQLFTGLNNAKISAAIFGHQATGYAKPKMSHSYLREYAALPINSARQLHSLIELRAQLSFQSSDTAHSSSLTESAKAISATVTTSSNPSQQNQSLLGLMLSRTHATNELTPSKNNASTILPSTMTGQTYKPTSDFSMADVLLIKQPSFSKPMTVDLSNMLLLNRLTKGVITTERANMATYITFKPFPINTSKHDQPLFQLLDSHTVIKPHTVKSWPSAAVEHVLTAKLLKDNAIGLSANIRNIPSQTFLPIVTAQLLFNSSIPSQISPAVSDLLPMQRHDIAGVWLPMILMARSQDKPVESGIDRLLRHVLGGIVRIQNLQMDALTQAREGSGSLSPGSHWQLEIPLPMGDRWNSAMINIYKDEEKNQEKSAEDDGEVRWGMRLCFDLEPYGQLTVDASLSGRRLDATMWTSDGAMQQRVEGHIEELLTRLRNAGLHVEQIPCRQGEVPPLKGKKAFEVETTS